MTDRELLELAAKAAELFCPRYVSETSWGTGMSHGKGNEVYRIWNPLTDDGDALRLAVKLNIDIYFGKCAYQVNAEIYDWAEETVAAEAFEDGRNDPYAATRRAIVRSAAEIGKEMK